MGRVTFRSGGLVLEGVFNPRSGAPGVVLCHPHPSFGGTMDNSVILALEARLSADMAVLRFNFRGAGRYDGGRGELEDVRAAVGFLAERGAKPVAVVGYSFGAWVGMCAGAADARVAALAGISPPVAMFDFGAVQRCAKPKLFVVGDGDQLIPKAKFEPFYAGAAEPKRLVTVAGADHLWRGREVEAAEPVRKFLTGVLRC